MRQIYHTWMVWDIWTELYHNRNCMLKPCWMLSLREFFCQLGDTVDGRNPASLGIYKPGKYCDQPISTPYSSRISFINRITWLIMATHLLPLKTDPLRLKNDGNWKTTTFLLKWSHFQHVNCRNVPTTVKYDPKKRNTLPKTTTSYTWKTGPQIAPISETSFFRSAPGPSVVGPSSQRCLEDHSI